MHSPGHCSARPLDKTHLAAQQLLHGDVALSEAGAEAVDPLRHHLSAGQLHVRSCRSSALCWTRCSRHDCLIMWMSVLYCKQEAVASE